MFNPRSRRRDSCDTRASAPPLELVSGTPAQGGRARATSDSGATARADRARARETGGASRRRGAREGLGARARRESSALCCGRLRLSVVAQHVVHEGIAAARLEGGRAPHQRLLRLDEVLAAIAPDAPV